MSNFEIEASSEITTGGISSCSRGCTMEVNMPI